MNPEIKAQWIAALRSGEYEQGIGALHCEGKFCCLGVLCDVAVRAGQKLQVTRRASWVEYDGSGIFLPRSVIDWAGLNDDDPSITDAQGDDSWLSAQNDKERTFEEIADLIEAQL